MYYRIKELCIKLVIKTSLYYAKIRDRNKARKAEFLHMRVPTDRRTQRERERKTGGQTGGQSHVADNYIHLLQPLFASSSTSCAGGTCFKIRKEFDYHDISVVSLSPPRQEPG
jgi:hypothetical protein